MGSVGGVGGVGGVGSVGSVGGVGGVGGVGSVGGVGRNSQKVDSIVPPISTLFSSWAEKSANFCEFFYSPIPLPLVLPQSLTYNTLKQLYPPKQSSQTHLPNAFD
ncbi:MAG: hypothetical protein F6K40_16995 [Okeania sp. SIO3I5]|uniref:hypothetical protein n=1 Tax=Okeania sp. SIO3I5 TaxID=2607805 RepID=UPI0013B5E53F|nr:hypothetical protein [Okeania sp. SIO3I5]NEQ37863.1 hypothetical protein [Okeania sp. SIO3I5]